MSYEAVRWVLYDAPMLFMPSGKPDIAARFVLLARAERAGKDGRGTYAGLADLVKATGYDVRTIQRAERRLEEAGLMVRRGVSHLGTPRWDLSLKTKGDSEAFVSERIERRRKLTAERVRRHRQKAESETPEGAEDIEVDVRNDDSVTASEALRNASEERYVTPFNDGCNALNATRTTSEPPRETTRLTTLGGTLPPNPLRPPSPPAPGTYSQNSLAVALTPAQDQQSDPLPREGPLAAVVELRPGISQEARYRPAPQWTTGAMAEVAAAAARRAARRAEYQAQLAAEKEAQ